MQALLTAIVVWLSATFDLPATHDHPRVELVPTVQMATLRYKVLVRAGYRGTAPTDRQQAELARRYDLEAFYDDATRTIHLRDDWTGTTPAEISVVVHEMVHHLQNMAELKYACAQAREKLAFAAQEKWLGLFGRSLKSEFQLDPMTLLLRTNCMH